MLERTDIAEQIFPAMKNNGSLRLDDEKKLNICRSVYDSSHAEKEDSRKLPSMFPNYSKPHFPHGMYRSNFVINPNPLHIDTGTAVAANT
jgi:hypothetical protein